MRTEERESSRQYYFRWICVVLYSLFLFFSAVYIYPLARLAQEKGYGWMGIFFSRTVVTVLSVFLVVQSVRSLRRGRLINVLIMLLIGASFIIAFHVTHLPIERFHFVQFGILGIFVFWALSGRPYTLQFYLTALNIILGVSYCDELIQGLVPNRFYDLQDIFVDILSGTMGLLLFRIIDLGAPPPLHPASRTKHGQLTEPLPLIDLHIYGRDLLHLVPLVVILLVNQHLVTSLRPEHLLGDWSCDGSSPCLLALEKESTAILRINDTACAETYTMEGNLLDGFRLRLTPTMESEDAAQGCGISSDDVFHIRKNAGDVYLWHNDLGILKKGESRSR
jgi:hypothetical protein